MPHSWSCPLGHLPPCPLSPPLPVLTHLLRCRMWRTSLWPRTRRGTSSWKMAKAVVPLTLISSPQLWWLVSVGAERQDAFTEAPRGGGRQAPGLSWWVSAELFPGGAQRPWTALGLGFPRFLLPSLSTSDVQRGVPLGPE